MSSLLSRLRTAAFLSGSLIASAVFLVAQSNPPKEDEEVVILSCFEVGAGYLGATVGGAKDINFFRSGAGRGQVPHPDSLTPEGLFSAHDLPLTVAASGTGLFRVQCAATSADFEVLPNVRYLAQLGLGSALQADTWQRAPLNLVAVVDKSGSMDGEPLALVRASLHGALQHLRDGDRLSIVLYGDRSHVHLPPTDVTAGTRDAIAAQINGIQSAGSTNMEAGLRLGYEVARGSAATFPGTTRLMLFTDERPNVGETDAGSFMDLARSGAADGIGLTTIGVSVQFDTELAGRIASVQGGNLFYFAEGKEMTKTFTEDFDTLVTELARDFSVRIAPAPGLRIDGVFGIPGDLLRWEGKALVLDIATIFLSKRKGAIYFALSHEPSNPYLPARHARPGDALAEIAFSYRETSSNASFNERATCRLLRSDDSQPGLRRGRLLVDEYLTVKRAAQAHLFDNDQETAFRLVSGLLHRLEQSTDATLEPELTLTRDLSNTFALLSGHTGEIRLDGNSATSPLVGVWRRSDASPTPDADDYLIVWPHGVIEPISVNRETRVLERQDSIALDGPVPSGAHGIIAVAEENRARFDTVEFLVEGNRLTLTNRTDAGQDPVTFKRWTYADIPAIATTTHTPSDPIDELSGLPPRLSRNGSPRVGQR